MTRRNRSGQARINADVRRLLRFLGGRRKRISPLLILTHDHPDPDAIASAAALKFLVENRYGIEARIVHGGVIGRTENLEMVSRLKIPIRQVRPNEIAKAGNVALVDTQPAFRNNRYPRNRRATIVIDQHRSVEPPNADFAAINLRCGATSVILTYAVFAARLTPPPGLATALAYGILTDTLHFFRSNEPAVIRAYLKLLPLCDLPSLAKIQNPPRSGRFFSTLARGIRQAVACRDIVISHLGPVENPDLVSQTADFFLTYDKVRWSLVTGRWGRRLCMSLRASKPGVEAGEILRDICGDRAAAGGHGGIAGGSFEVPPSASEAAWRAEENGLLIRLLDRLKVPSRAAVRFPFRDDHGPRR